MARKRKRRPGIPNGLWITAVTLAVALSVGVRWSGLRNRFESEPSEIQIEVLNGNGVSGVAMKVAVELRKEGIDVLIVDDAEHFHFERSIIVDRKGDREILSRLSRLTGCRRIVEQKQIRPLVDATLIIGRDMNDLSLVD